MRSVIQTLFHTCNSLSMCDHGMRFHDLNLRRAVFLFFISVGRWQCELISTRI